jgi:hypothetical protein
VDEIVAILKEVSMIKHEKRLGETWKEEIGLGRIGVYCRKSCPILDKRIDPFWKPMMRKPFMQTASVKC